MAARIAGDLGFGHVEVGLRAFIIGARSGILLVKLRVTVERLLIECQRSLFFFQLCLCIVESSLRGQQIVVLRHRIDFGDQITLFHGLAQRNVHGR